MILTFRIIHNLSSYHVQNHIISFQNTCYWSATCSIYHPQLHR